MAIRQEAANCGRRVDPDTIDFCLLIAATDSHEYEGVWCVLDTELDPELATSLVQEAKGGGVHVALSTPCFEVWLILHHRASAR
jgi:hypothetical protein